MVEHSLGKGEVESSILSASSRCKTIGISSGSNGSPGALAPDRVTCGSNSVVESQPSKLLVAGSIPVSRSNLSQALRRELLTVVISAGVTC